ncbi:leucyl/phenylalanyl-tRNA-protein transferase [Rhodovulum sulfidophilum]|uniref:Leucyl/phenylalanyl-tRNA--protein transferase n=1 Tax=Rhodovulum sulfidophilum TaxID=35806 RepID=A0A0D6B4Z2_RHOSU|nr:leucyl/phenylalanyl-tRNA-protein transferase [Rhodovulum sulfidophilum]
MMDAERLTPLTLLRAYAMGIFPMAESRHDPRIFWVNPRKRGIFPLEGFHISKSLARTIRRGRFRIRTDSAFEHVVECCADRPETWINAEIFRLYRQLFDLGHAHSIEVWQDDILAGGVYGVTLGSAFFGESMFSRRTDASKVALAYLVDRLRIGGFTLFDTQFLTDHLASLGAIEIEREDYLSRLERAVNRDANFDRASPIPEPQLLLQRSTQTS